ncbi:hypothetical protein N7530_005646, partial [Penicillium desertorum]
PKGHPLLISLYIPRAYRHALILVFPPSAFKHPHHTPYRGHFALFLIFVFVAISADSVVTFSASEPLCSSQFVYSRYAALMRQYRPIII